MLDLSVVIPTYNRRELLSSAVDSLRNQSHPADRYEIVVVSDGCTDGTDDRFATPLQQPVTRLVRQEKQGFGLAAARNLGIRSAAGKLVLFLDDDMVADERLVAAHVAAHAQFEGRVGVCGQVKPATELPQTPFCRLVIGDICQLFAENPEAARFLPAQLALSWQTSFERAELERLGGYDDTFRFYGWEDIEFSYRAGQQGARFYYEPRAVSYHRDQSHTLGSHAQRVRRAARMAPVLFARHAALKDLIDMYADKEPIDWHADSLRLIGRKIARQMLARRPIFRTLEAMTPFVERATTSRPGLLRRWYNSILGSYALIGYHEGLVALAAPAPSPRQPEP